MPLRILFLSRACPPVVGGIENQNAALSKWLGKKASVTTMGNPFGKKFLPIFLPFALLRTLFTMHRFDVVLLGDGVLAIIGWCVKWCSPKRTVISIVHGLDITYPLFLYRSLWVRLFLPKLDRLIAVGNETIRAGVERSIPLSRFAFVPNGVDTNAHYHPEYTARDLEGILGESTHGKRILLTSGRLAKRKGVAWFIRNVLPKLPENIIYIVAGDGPDRTNITSAITETRLFTRVKLLGYVSDRARDILMNRSDIFVQPNIRVAGDMEGFGLSVVEAASCAIPVVASRLEGLQDAISDQENGFLVEPEDPNAWREALTPLLEDESFRKACGERARTFVLRSFDWSVISERYITLIHETFLRTSGQTPPVDGTEIGSESIRFS
ncbi:MAG: glycosyltransferase family 4 protein [Candidatus Moraniibacteriota bacterium]|nr:MAG: glycosyltransferase family 4 protein [Candidatus Moranbacteria bacterium]